MTIRDEEPEFTLDQVVYDSDGEEKTILEVSHPYSGGVEYAATDKVYGMGWYHEDELFATLAEAREANPKVRGQ